MSLVVGPVREEPEDHGVLVVGEVITGELVMPEVLEHLPTSAAAALARVPGMTLDPFDRLLDAFLEDLPANTARGYRTDLHQWSAWCHHEASPEYRTHPLLAVRPHVAAWKKHLSSTPSE